MIAGIDPGMKGAIGLLYDDGTAYVYDMPVFESFASSRRTTFTLRR